MIEAIEVLEGKINESNALDGELNKNVEYVEPTTQEKTAIPTKQQQIILPDENIFALSKVIVNPIGDEYIIPTGTEEISSNGLYDIKNKEYANVSISPNLQNKSLTITSNTTTNIQADENYDGLENVSITTNVQPNLQEKSITITSNTQTTIEKDSNYDGISSVVVTTNVPPVNEWEQYGYQTEPSYIKEIKDVCDEIIENYDTSITSWSSKYTTTGFGKQILIFPGVDSSNVTNFNNAFNGQTQLKNIALFDTSSGTNLGYMFYGCNTLRTIPQFDLSSANTTSYMFYQCYQLNNIPDLDLSSCTNCSNMFNNCTKLFTAPNITLSDSSSLNLGNMFKNCSALENVPIYDISHITTSGRLGNMFQACNHLTDVSLNNILYMCSKNTIYSGAKTLAHLGFTSTNYPASRIQGLSNYQAFTAAGWSIGY